jgi:hypothetical protein
MRGQANGQQQLWKLRHHLSRWNDVRHRSMRVQRDIVFDRVLRRKHMPKQTDVVLGRRRRWLWRSFYKGSGVFTAAGRLCGELLRLLRHGRKSESGADRMVYRPKRRHDGQLRELGLQLQWTA